MAEATVKMEHPNGDVRVVPKELEKRYADRGWTKAKASSNSTSSSSK